MADSNTTSVNGNQPRMAYLDIYTSPGLVYSPMTLKISIPETVLGNSIPAGSVCLASIHYVGIYAKCVQQMFINANRVTLYQT
jgi:hypothetical protein